MKKHYYILLIAVALSSCTGTIKDVPAGYVGKVLTTNGWDSKIHKSGQVDLGNETFGGRKSSLVLLEVTSVTIKEQFLGKDENPDHTDHRVMTKDGTPLSMDIYLLIGIPEDDATRNGIFTLITPEEDKTLGKVITIQSVYDRLVKLGIRGEARNVIAKYNNPDSVMSNLEHVNDELFSKIIAIQKASKAPFEVISAKISNIKEDESILQSKNDRVAATNKASAMDIIGEAARRNPEYMKMRKWDVIEKVGMTNKNMILMDISERSGITIPVSRQE